MPRVLVVHHDKPTCEFLKLMASPHAVEVARDLKSAVRLILAAPPDCILVGQDREHELAVRLLTWLRRNVLNIPAIAIIARGGAVHRSAVLKLGVAGLLETPIDRQQLTSQIASAIAASLQAAAGPPPIAEEELDSNLSVLETSLNHRMKCFGGQNQVFLQSTLTSTTTTRPRICLKCALRVEYGLPREVYYTFIRDVCCGDPDRCEAYRKFRAAREIA